MSSWRIFLLCFCIVNLCCFSQDNSEDIKELRKELQQLRNKVDKLERSLHQKDQELQESRNLQKKVDTIEKVLEDKGIYDDFTKEDFEDPNELDAYFDGRFHLKTKDGNFELAFFGFAFIDTAFVHEDQAIQDQIDNADDYLEFRAFRPTVSVNFLKRYFLVFQPEFAVNNEVAFRNVFMGMRGLPFNGQIQIGFFREYIGFDGNHGIPNIPFMERSLPTDLTPEFQLGIGYSGHSDDERMTFSVGLFREVEDDDPPRVENDSGSYAGTGKVTFLPIWQDNGNFLMHVGGAYSYRSPLENQVQFNARPEIGAGPQFVDTGVIENVDEVHLGGVEWALLIGAFSMQAEGMLAIIDSNDAAVGRENFWAVSVSATYTLTGEKRPYLTKNGVFGRIVPKVSFDEGGPGAIELAVRYSRIDLNDDAIRGGRLQDITLGANWYINQFLVFQVNYIYALISNLDNAQRTDAHILALRLKLIF